MKKYYIGIDLGTTNTMCSIVEADGNTVNISPLDILQPDCIGDDTVSYHSQPKLESRVFIPANQSGIFCGGYTLTGHHALSGTEITGIKMKMGDDRWTYRYGKNDLTPTHISAIILKTVYNSLVTQIPLQDIQSVIITIPASFSSKMRDATLEAARLAGFGHLRVHLVDEPVAAVFSSWQEPTKSFSSFNNRQPFFVFDMGGGTVDVSVLELNTEKNEVDVLSTSRYNDLGGRDIDIEIAAFLLGKFREATNASEELKKLLSEADPESTKIFLRKLVSLGEKVKIFLSNKLPKPEDIAYTDFDNLLSLVGNGKALNPEYSISYIDSTFWGSVGLSEHIDIPISELLSVIKPFISLKAHTNAQSMGNIFDPIVQALTKAQKPDLEQCYLVGGSSMFKPLYLELNSKYTVHTQLDTAYAVAKGAAWYAYLSMLPDRPWHLKEKTIDKIFMRREGQNFVEIMPEGIEIGGTSIKGEEYFTGINTIKIKSSETQPVLEFYQGQSSHDHAMAYLFSKPLNIKIPFVMDALVESIEATINRDKVYSFIIHIREESEIDTIPVQVKYIRREGDRDTNLDVFNKILLNSVNI